MFTQSAPWSRKFPMYTPPEYTSRRMEKNDRTPRASQQSRSNRDASYGFGADTANVDEAAPARRLCKTDFRRLRRFQNHRMRIRSACRLAVIAMLMFGWLVPIYVASHQTAVCAIAHHYSALIQSALSNLAIEAVNRA